MPRESKTEHVTHKLTPREKLALERAADRDGMNVSEYVRRAVAWWMEAEATQRPVKERERKGRKK